MLRPKLHRPNKTSEAIEKRSAADGMVAKPPSAMVTRIANHVVPQTIAHVM